MATKKTTKAKKAEVKEVKEVKVETKEVKPAPQAGFRAGQNSIGFTREQYLAQKKQAEMQQQPANVFKPGTFKAPSPSDAKPATADIQKATPVAVVDGNAFILFYNNGQIWKMDTPFVGGNDKYYYSSKDEAMKRASDLKGAGYNVKIYACTL